MGKKEDLTGQKFGKLLVIRELPKEDRMGKKVTYECLCDCGNTTKAMSDTLKRSIKTSCGCANKTHKDLTGHKFGKLTAVEEVAKEDRLQNRSTWICQCSCGTTLRVVASDLTRGRKKDCGCVPTKTTKKDLTGMRFGMLTAIEDTGRREHRQLVWRCLCDCGNYREVMSTYLLSGKSYSCGCTQRNRMDIAGKKFGKLTVIKELLGDNRIGDKKNCTWLCQCDCGNQVEALASYLTRGRTNSCGCVRSPDLTGNVYSRLTVVEKTTERYRKQIVWKCQCECGNYKMVPTYSLTNGGTKSCGCLNRSNGERIVYDYLTDKDVDFYCEYTFSELYYKTPAHPLRFDFALFDNGGSLKLLVEYDGEQHQVPVDLLGGEEALEDLVARDNLKNNYCIENNIPLIRIPYTSYNEIEEILDKALKDYVL